MSKEIAIAKIRTDGLQMRVEMNESAIAEYTELMADGTVFPPITLFLDGSGTYWLADGFHRFEAAKRNGRRTVTADVRNGEWIDALRYALFANSGHGMRMTNADKRHALETAWGHRRELFGKNDPTVEWLANTCGVARRTAASFYGEICANCTDLTPVRQNASGRVYTAPKRPREICANCTDLNQMRPKTPESPKPAQLCAGAEQPEARNAESEICANCTDLPSTRGRELKPSHAVPVDRFGVEIPLEIGEAFGEDMLADIATLISKARVALRHGLDDKLPQFAAVRQDALVQLDNAYRFVSAAEPHCVCRMCQGQGCKACHGRGWQTEEEYKRNPKEFQAGGAE